MVSFVPIRLRHGDAVMFSISFRIRGNNLAIKEEKDYGINCGLNETQKKIINLMKANSVFTVEQIVKAVGCKTSDRNIYQ